MNIAVIGSGIAGLTTAWQLTGKGHQVTIFEMRERPALLAHTARFTLDGKRYDVDSLLIWPRYHRDLIRLLDELGLSLRTRWFSSVAFFTEGDPKPYAGYVSKRVPLLRRNVLLPFGRTAGDSFAVYRFWLRHWLRAQWTRRRYDPGVTFGEHFAADTDPLYRKLIFPWVNCAIGFPMPDILARMPAMSILQFELATLAHLPRMVAEGMTELARRLADGSQLRLGHEVRRVEPGEDGVEIAGRTSAGESFGQDFDQVVLAVPPTRIPDLVEGLSDAERRIWSSFEDSVANLYLHVDERVMPRDRGDWAAINYRLRDDPGAQVEFTVWTSLVGGIEAGVQLFQSWNPVVMPAPETILYHNRLIRVLPTVECQSYLAHDIPRLQGRRRLWYTGTWVEPYRGSYLEEGVRASRRLALAIHQAQADAPAVSSRPERVVPVPLAGGRLDDAHAHRRSGSARIRTTR